MSSYVFHFLIAMGMMVLPPMESEQNVMFLLQDPSCVDKCRAGGLVYYQEGDLRVSLGSLTSGYISVWYLPCLYVLKYLP